VKLLTFTSLYPNATNTSHGIFVETRLRHLIGSGNVKAIVVAPVPWFPFANPVFGSYSRLARVPRLEWRHGLQVVHPRYAVFPKIGMTVTPLTMAIACYPVLKRIQQSGYAFDLIDAHYYYPDGVAAMLLGHWLNKPVTITARGTDVNFIPRYWMPRRMIRWAARHAVASIGVCRALCDELARLGVPNRKLHVLRNGVDLKLFHPIDRVEVQRRLCFQGFTVLSVGHLIERKGHHIAIQMASMVSDITLVIIGAGPEEVNLKEQVATLQLEGRVRFVSPVSPPELKDYYGAADALVLASSREGWANVLLESMACGTPVVATNIWGTPEVVNSVEAGVLVDRRNAAALAAGLDRLRSNYPDRLATRRYAEGFAWDHTTNGQLALFRSIIESHESPVAS
jgi:teichuronic acid biosynthesis glycosyltransferase TuaC